MSETAAQDSEDIEWERARQKALKQAGHECRFCGMGDEEHQEEHDQSLHVHHIIPRKAGGSDHIGNLLAVCRSCHRTIESTQGKALKRIQENEHSAEEVAELKDEIEHLKSEVNRLEADLDRERRSTETVVSWVEERFLDVYVVAGDEGMTGEVVHVSADEDDAIQAFRESGHNNLRVETHSVKLSDFVADNLRHASSDNSLDAYVSTRAGESIRDQNNIDAVVPEQEWFAVKSNLEGVTDE